MQFFVKDLIMSKLKFNLISHVSPYFILQIVSREDTIPIRLGKMEFTLHLTAERSVVRESVKGMN